MIVKKIRLMSSVKRYAAVFAILCLMGSIVLPSIMTLQAQTPPPPPNSAPPSNVPHAPAESNLDANTDPVADGTPNPENAKAVAAAPGNVFTLTMKDFGDTDGYTLKTVKTERKYYFTRPSGWKILPQTSIKVVFQHAPNLLPERSSLNILVNNRVLKTVSLTKENAVANTVEIPVPSEILKDKNSVTFQVDQHYTYKCEDPFSPELWSTILPGTELKMVYAPQPIQADLARMPLPFYDPLGYGKTTIGYVAPNKLSAESFEALATVATFMAQQVGWKPLQSEYLSSSGLGDDKNLVLIGTPAENSAIASLGSSLPVPLSGEKFSNPKAGGALEDGTGVIQLVANPSHPDKAILVISGNTPAAVKNAAHLLAENPANRLLTGNYAIIKEYHPGPSDAYRAWDGFLQRSGNSFENLKLETLSSRGITALPLFYKMRLMPDLMLPGQTKVKVKTVYSYASQLLPDQSKLEVLFNGKPLKSVQLNDLKGKNLETTTFEIPSEEVHTFNDLTYQFHLFPEKYDLCRYVTDVHIWGTIHNSSTIEVPGEVKSAIPDLGLINDAGFPFTGYQDFTQVGVVLPENPENKDIQTMLSILSRLGKESSSRGGIKLTVSKANQFPDEVKKNSHLIVIGAEERNAVMKELGGKIHLVTQGNIESLKGVDQKLVDLQYNTEKGLLEEMLSPWNNNRVVLVAAGQSEEAFKRLQRLFEEDEYFGKIQAGNILAVGENGPKTLTVLEKGKARFVLPSDLMAGETLPMWIIWVVGFFAVLGLLATLRFLFGR